MANPSWLSRTESTSMSLVRRRLDDNAAAEIGKELALDTHFQSLRLDGSKGAQALAVGLANNHALAKLSLSANLIGDEGATVLADALSFNTSLRCLDLHDNSITDNGGHALLQGLLRSKSVRSVVLSPGNMISVDLAEQIANAACIPPPLAESDASSSQVPHLLAKVAALEAKVLHYEAQISALKAQLTSREAISAHSPLLSSHFQSSLPTPPSAPSGIRLSSGAITRIAATGKWEPDVMLQVLRWKQILPSQAGSTAATRIRLSLSDGTHSVDAILAVQVSASLGTDPDLEGAIVKISEATCVTVNAPVTRKFYIVCDMTVLARHQPIIGSPTPPAASGDLDSAQSTSAATGPGAEPRTLTPGLGLTPFGQLKTSPLPLNDDEVKPIASLNPYMSKWQIKARVTRKSDLRKYKKAGKAGQSFHVDLIDEENSEIRATCFDSVAEQFYGVLEEGQVYLISKATVCMANKRFSKMKGDYAITLAHNTVVEHCVDDPFARPQQNSPEDGFTQIADLAGAPANSKVHLLAVVTAIGDLRELNTKYGSLHRVDLTLLDMSRTSIAISLWKKHADKCKAKKIGDILEIRNARVSDFGGKSLNTVGTTKIKVNPNHGNAHLLLAWFEAEGPYCTSSIVLSSPPKQSALWLELDKVESTVYQKEGRVTFWCNAEVGLIRETPWCYQACPDCACKVVQMLESWYCSKCAKSCDSPRTRYLLKVRLIDHTGSLDAFAFDESAEPIIGRSAAELLALSESSDPAVQAQFSHALHRSKFKPFRFKIQAFRERWHDQERLSAKILACQPFDAAEASKSMLAKALQLASQPA